MRSGLAHGSSALLLHRTASLRFQPTKRPQISTQKPKSRPPLQKVLPSVGNVNPQDTLVTKTTVISAKGTGKNTLADWTAEDNDVNDFYGGEKRQRGGRKKRKKNKEESYVSQNWDDIYDPSRPNSYEEYKNSDEKIMELKEWKDKLYAHRVARRRSNDSDSTGDDRLKMQKSMLDLVSRDALSADYRPDQSARPGLSFAPPAHFEQNFPPSPDHPPANVPDDPTGEDAYARRMRLSSTGNRTDHTTRNSGSLQGQAFYPPPPPLSATATAPAPPPPAAYDAQPQLSSQHEPEMLPSTISKAPVRYILPPAPVEIPRSEAELEKALQTYEAQEDAVSEAAPRSLRPGQKGFAERLMSKYGWTKGSGLGASGAGIVNPLRVQLEKQKKKPDSEGGGFVGPGGRGKIVGGKKKAGSGAESETGKFGLMSEVVVLHGMVDGIDLVAELEAAGDGGIMQEIGEECGEKVSFDPSGLLDYKLTNDDFSMVALKGYSSIAATHRKRLCLSNLPVNYRH